MNLYRFKEAQEGPAGFEVAVRELHEGAKRSHWIWYVFPQIEGLGHSAAATRFGIAGAEEATAYLKDPVLRGRLLEAARAVAAKLDATPPPALATLMGSDIDALKLISSMTLFREVAARVGDEAIERVAAQILSAAQAQGYPPCRFTLERLG